MNKVIFICLTGMLCGLCPFLPWNFTLSGQELPTPDDILKKTGLKRGLAVLLNDPEGKTALQLLQKSELILFLQYSSEADSRRAAEIFDEKEVYGTRVYIDTEFSNKISLADNYADVLISPGSTSLPAEEILRILKPEGIAFIAKQEIKKPWPEGYDEWRTPYHGSDNNPLANDAHAKPPYITQFLATPLNGPAPQVALASGGRTFKFYGNIAFKKREELVLNTLICRNAFNGIELWRKKIQDGTMIHRNNIIAEPDALYWGYDQGCQVYNPRTGELIEKLMVPDSLTDEKNWFWIAKKDNVLYALAGKDDFKDPVVKIKKKSRNWKWHHFTKGYQAQKFPWGFGKTLFAFSLDTKKVLWSHQEEQPIDGRGICMSQDKIFFSRLGENIGCLDSATGKEIWKKTSEKNPEIFAALGTFFTGQGIAQGWKTSSYIKCNQEVLVLSGTQMTDLAVLSTKTGKLLWKTKGKHFQSILKDGFLYSFAGSRGSKKFEANTGKVLGDLIGRGNCTRPTANGNLVFTRKGGSTNILDLETNQLFKANGRWISTMGRPPCHDGITTAFGLSYWWPWACDCNGFSLGLICRAHRKKDQNLPDKEKRLVTFNSESAAKEESKSQPEDWLTYRKNNRRDGISPVAIPEKIQKLWEFKLPKGASPTAPVTSKDKIFFAGSNGIIYAIDEKSGKPVWKAYTGGGMRLPPSIRSGKVFAGSGDGWFYCFEEASGKKSWKFLGARQNRKIMTAAFGVRAMPWPRAK